MKVIDVEKYNEDVLPDTLENIMNSYVNLTDDSNSTFNALKIILKVNQNTKR